MSFAHERAAFEQLQKLLGESTVYLIDTYDTLEGARRAAALGRPLWGVRLDSGNWSNWRPRCARSSTTPACTTPRSWPPAI